MTLDGVAKHTHDRTINLHTFEVSFCITDEMLQRVRLFEPHRRVLEQWDASTFFARLSTLTALAKATRDQCGV